MEGRSPEFAPIEKELTDDGFSEKRAARLVEGIKKDNSQLKKNLPVGRQGKPVSASPVRKVRLPAILRKRTTSSKKVISRRDKI